MLNKKEKSCECHNMLSIADKSGTIETIGTPGFQTPVSSMSVNNSYDDVNTFTEANKKIEIEKL